MTDTNTSETIREFTPSKDTYTSLKSDVDLELAIQELVDNSLDAWERHSGRNEPLTISIEINPEGEGPDLVISDDAGGVYFDEAPMLFSLGRTAKEHVPGTIGTFGLGAKKAIVNLGVPFTIASWHEDESEGWEYTITEDWLIDDDNWEVSINRNAELKPGRTEIQIHDLEYELSESTIETLGEKLEDTYNLLLDDSLKSESYQLTIFLNEEIIEPKGLPDWTYSPFDGLYPRRFENIELELESVEESIYLNITVGLLRKKHSQDAGTDIYCQNRKVIHAARDSIGGYGSGRNRLGNFTVHQERLKILVELETDGDASSLPWDTQKSSINQHTEVMKRVYEWLSNIAQPYFDITPTSVPRSFVEFYPNDDKYAANNGRIEIYDYSDRTMLAPHHKPNTSVPEVAAIQQRCKAHALLRFRCFHGIEKWMIPAYKNQLDAELPSGVTRSDLPLLEGDEPLKGLDEMDAVQAKDKITKLAKYHARNGVKYSENLHPWQVPCYELFFEQNVSKNVKLTDSPSNSLPTTPEELEESRGKQTSTRRKGSNDSSKLGDTAESSPDTTNDVLPEADITVAMIINEGEGEQITNLIAHNQVELNEALGLEPSANRDELYNELRRRLELMVQFGAGIPNSKAEK